ncbi:hypothetical protein JCM19274_3793 [Algibacter lectus]|uniref:Uncharacterized protein n=1 Tax=Algibacter lectus TaxID=221126 RepID=A0A090WVE7_9FLAO|nr:hypothetical protein JCM19274_3793 [Algibacter lectus]
MGLKLTHGYSMFNKVLISDDLGGYKPRSFYNFEKFEYRKCF